MKTNLATFLTSLLASGGLLLTAGPAHSETEAPDAAAIKKTAEEFHQALAGGKPDQVMALLHADALIVEGGTVQTRKEYKREHLPADIAYAAAVPGKQLNAVVQQDGDVAWVTSTFTVKGTFQSKEINDLAAETMVLTKTPAGWLIRSIHWSSQKVRKTKS
ncbi:MAG: nuclear transport factor 2 family protein [Chthoniobacterales bacterium]